MGTTRAIRAQHVRTLAWQPLRGLAHVHLHPWTSQPCKQHAGCEMQGHRHQEETLVTATTTKDWGMEGEGSGLCQ